ncbi:protein of unknown function [Burkholderia multivorans]
MWMTEGEVIYWYGDVMGAKRLEETRRDRNLHPLPLCTQRTLKMPDFIAPTDDELRDLWRPTAAMTT